MKQIDKQRGITLITLVVTIVVLLIVTSITVATLSGSPNTVKTARDAKDDVEIQSETDAIQSIVTEVASESTRQGDFSGTINFSKLKQKLSDIVTTNSNKFPLEGTLRNGEKVTIADDGKVIVGEYVKDGLILHYDAINNTGDGHSNTATTWKDLSGNGNDGSISSSQQIKWNVDNFETSKNESIMTPWKFENTYTILVTLEPLEFYDYNTIWDNSKSLDDNECWIYSNGILNFRSMAGMTYYIGGYASSYKEGLKLNLNEKLQVAVVVDNENNECSIYRDGKKKNSIAGGINLNGGQLAFNGCVNTKGMNKYYSMLVYNKALNDDEIKNNYKVDKQRFNIR